MSILSIDLHSPKSTIRLSFHFQNVTYKSLDDIVPRAVTAYLQSEAVTSVPWPAMIPDLNHIEHIWDMLGRRIHAREPPVQNIRQLEAALHREWQQLSQKNIRRLTGGMRRRVDLRLTVVTMYCALHAIW
jgi:hypothetical protein